MLKRVIKAVAKRTLPRYRVNWRNRGFINFIDVGSNGGLPEPWDKEANSLRVVLNFEPNDKPVQKGPVFTYNTAIWDEDCERSFYVYQSHKGVGSSLLPQNIEYVREHFDTLRQRGDPRLAETWFDRAVITRTVKVRCRPLDAVVDEQFPGLRFHFLKIDAQGAEGNILKGAEKVLRTCDGLCLELFTLPLYKGAMLPEVVERLKGFGYQLARKMPPHGTFDSQHDCVFLRDGGDPKVQDLVRRLYGC